MGKIFINNLSRAENAQKFNYFSDVLQEVVFLAHQPQQSMK